MNEAFERRVFSILQKDLGVDPAILDLDKPIRDQISLDSMQFVSLIARIEIALDIELPVSIMNVATLRDFLDRIDMAARDHGKL